MRAKKVSDRWKRSRDAGGNEKTGPTEEVSRDQLRAHMLLVSVSADILDATCKMINKKRAELNFATEICIPGPDGKVSEMLRPLYQTSITMPVSQLEDAAKVIDLLLEQEEIRERLDRGGCLHCGKRLLPGKRKYCSRKCTNVFLQRKHRNKQVIEVFERDKLRLGVAGPDAIEISEKPKK